MLAPESFSGGWTFRYVQCWALAFHSNLPFGEYVTKWLCEKSLNKRRCISYPWRVRLTHAPRSYGQRLRRSEVNVIYPRKLCGDRGTKYNASLNPEWLWQRCRWSWRTPLKGVAALGRRRVECRKQTYS